MKARILAMSSCDWSLFGARTTDSESGQYFALCDVARLITVDFPLCRAHSRSFQLALSRKKAFCHPYGSKPNGYA